MDCQANYRNCQSDAKHSHLEQRGFLCMCSAKIIYLFAIFLTFALGLILGAVFVATILPALPAIIVFAAVMAVLILALLVYRYCLCCRFKNRCD